jgi:outer membrane protein assembly factor BamA
VTSHKITIFIFICLIAVLGWSEAKNIKRIEYIGNKHFKDLAKLVATKVNSSLDSTLLISDQNSIRAVYVQTGFFWTEVNYRIMPKNDGVVLRWAIQENKQAQIGKIEIIGNEHIPDLIDNLKFTKGTFTQKTIEANIQTLLGIYLDSGYAFCQIEPKNFQLIDSNISYNLKVTEGPKVIINTVEFTGPLITRTSILKRIGGLDTNWVYSETKVKNNIKRLEKTNLFDVVKYEIKVREGGYFLQVEINEKKSNELQAAFAFLPKIEDRPAEYSGYVLANIKNLLGTMRQVNALWSKNTYRTNYELSYIEPFLFGLGMALGGTITHETRDTTYAKTNFNLFSDIAVQDNLTLRFETGYELVIPGIIGFERADTYWAGSGIAFDNRNQPINPKQGIYAILTNRIGRKITRNQTAQLVAKTYFESEIVLPFSDKLNFTFLLNGRNLFSSDTVNFYDLFHLGGARSLRGYLEEAFSSTRIFWLNNELRWRLGDQSRIFPFYDIGSYLKDNRYEIKMGYGLGLRVWSKIGLFGIDYGLAFGENPLNGKVHLTLTSQF